MSPAYPLTDQEVLYYLHIPKTAGTSFTDLLKSNFKPDESSFAVFIHEFLKLPPEVVAKYKVIAGHYFYNIQTFVPRTPVYVTILRDPIERTLSDYAYIRRTSIHYAYDLVKTQSLMDFLTDKRTQSLYVNTQTRYIAADPDTVEFAKKLTSAELNHFELWRHMENYAPNGFSDPALLERARERLHQMAFVGLAEQFDQSAEVLRSIFGWPSEALPKMLNVSPNRPAAGDIPQEALDIIRENTQLDAAVYEIGKQLFNARYQEMLLAHPESAQPPVNLDDSPVAALQRQVELQKRIIDSLQEEKAEQEKLIREMQSSFGWRFVLRVNAARQKLIPKDSKRESFYKTLRDTFVGK